MKPSPAHYPEILSSLEAVLRHVGAQLLAWRANPSMLQVHDRAALKTEGDAQAHRLLCEGIAAFSDAPIVSEEDAQTHGSTRPETYWIIDPIDGTASWLGGWDGFVCQAALMHANQPVLGAVYAPALGWMFGGYAGGGAFCNGERLAATDAHSTRLVITDNTPEPHGIAARVHHALGATGYIESGSLGLKLCRVVMGQADMFIKDVLVRDWDMAPAAVMLAELGYPLVHLNGAPYRFDGAMDKPGGFVAANRASIASDVVAWYAAQSSGGA